MKEIAYYSDDSYIGEGISLGISRGILVKYNDTNIVQEGTGIGSLAAKKGLVTYFATTCNTIHLSETQFRKTFLIDGIMLWQFNGRTSIFITKAVEILAQLYMIFPIIQKKIFLETSTRFRNLFKLTSQIKKTFPTIEASFNYSVQADELYVECEIKSLAGYLGKVYILNELGADYFKNGIKNGKIMPAPNGWNYIASNPDPTAFYNPEYDLSFFVKNINAKNAVPYKVFWGREKTKDLSWAGFEFEFDFRYKRIKSFGCSYIIKIK